LTLWDCMLFNDSVSAASDTSVSVEWNEWMIAFRQYGRTGKETFAGCSECVLLLVCRNWGEPRYLSVSRCLDYIAWSGKMVDGWRIEICVEGSGRGLVEVPSRNLPEKTVRNVTENDQCPGRDMNTALPEYKLGTLSAAPAYSMSWPRIETDISQTKSITTLAKMRCDSVGQRPTRYYPEPAKSLHLSADVTILYALILQVLCTHPMLVT
jgi:hypothetical protein